MNRSRRRILALIVGASALAGACALDAPDPASPLDATGWVTVLLYTDRNLDAHLDPNTDQMARGVRVEVATAGSGALVAEGETDDRGILPAVNLPVASYELALDSRTLGDTIQLLPGDSSRFLVSPGDTTYIVLRLGYPALPVEQARQAAPSRRISVDGVILNGGSTFSDSLVHLADSTAAIRLTRVAGLAVAEGDSVRVLGVVSLRDGQPTIAEPRVYRLGAATPVAPRPLTTAVAASADAGALDATLVQIGGVLTRDPSLLASGDVVVEADDGTGPLRVLLDRRARIATSYPLQAGANVQVTGILVPDGPQWTVRPRTSADVQVTYPLRTLLQARQLASGRFVRVSGVALNDWTAFADGTVHLSDSTGFIRAVRMARNNVVAGDLLEVTGTVAPGDGQPTLSGAIGIVQSHGGSPVPVVLSCLRAATADSGALDAALVRLNGVTITSVVMVGGAIRVRVSDSTGSLELLIDAATGVDAHTLVPGQMMDVTGLLVPDPVSLNWRVKPRGKADLTMR